MPTGFFIWGYMYPLPSFLGVHQHFWGCNVPSNSSFGGTKKMHFSTQGRAFCGVRFGLSYDVLCYFQQYFSYIMAVSFIGGGNRSARRNRLTCRKSLTNFII
jgi:hypothetical protein